MSVWGFVFVTGTQFDNLCRTAVDDNFFLYETPAQRFVMKMESRRASVSKFIDAGFEDRTELPAIASPEVCLA